MENVELFIAGVVVTLIVAGALALVVVGAILDGRNDQAHDTGVSVYPTTNGNINHGLWIHFHFGTGISERLATVHKPIEHLQ